MSAARAPSSLVRLLAPIRAVQWKRAWKIVLARSPRGRTNLNQGRAAALVLAAGHSLLACGEADDAPALRASRAEIIYGLDDRLQVFEGSLMAQRRAAESVAVLVPNELLDDDGQLASGAPTWQERDQLCPGERFANEPAMAFCTAVLVDWDLLLTAGHCAEAFALAEYSVVFGYFYASETKLALPSAVFHPVTVVSQNLAPVIGSASAEYAFLRLDRPVLSGQPAPVSRFKELAVGTPLTVISATGGVPLKVDAGGSIGENATSSPDYFATDTDTFHGSSGSGAFDAEGALIGVLARGGRDFVRTEDGCNATAHAAVGEANEWYTRASSALRSLCEKDASATSLCRDDCDEPCSALPTSSSLPRADATCSIAGAARTQSHGVVWTALLFACVGRRSWRWHLRRRRSRDGKPRPPR